VQPPLFFNCFNKIYCSRLTTSCFAPDTQRHICLLTSTSIYTRSGSNSGSCRRYDRLHIYYRGTDKEGFYHRKTVNLPSSHVTVFDNVMGTAYFDLRTLMARADSDDSGAARNGCFDATQRIPEHDTARRVETETFCPEQEGRYQFACLQPLVIRG